MFPTDEKGGRSTTTAGKKILAAALAAVQGGAEAAEKCSKERNWRFGYHKHFMKMVKLQCGDPKSSLDVAKAGLAYMHKEFQFVTKDDVTMPFAEAMTTITVKIVSQLTGDTEFASPETLVAFALGLTLFVFTLCLNILALYIVRKYREQYE